MQKKNVDILLIFPPLRTWDRPRNFPCGTGLIAGRLLALGYKVGVIDVNGLRWNHNQVMDEIDTYQTRVIGIGGMPVPSKLTVKMGSSGSLLATSTLPASMPTSVGE